MGGVLFATFGAQYLGTAIADYKQVLTASRSSTGSPDMPFRPASPQSAAAQQHHAQPAAPAAVAATYTQPHSAAATGAGGLAGTAAAMLHDSSSAYVDFNSTGSPTSISNSTGSSSGSFDTSNVADGHMGSSSSSTVSSSSRPVGRSVPADQLTKDQVEQLRESHKQRHKAAAAAAAASSPGAAGGGSGWEAEGTARHSTQDSQLGLQHQAQQQHPQQQQQQQQPPTWAYCSSGFYEASVWARLALAAAFVVLVAVGQGQPGLLVLALVNVLGALSMWGALRRQWLMHVMGDMPESAGAHVAAS